MTTKKETKGKDLGGEVVGRSPAEFAHAVGIGRTTLYCLPPECRPSSFKLGRREIITEPPAAWLARMQERGGTETLRKAAA